MINPLADARRALVDRDLDTVDGWHVWTETHRGIVLQHRTNCRLEAAVLRSRPAFLSRHGRPRLFKPIMMPCRLLPPRRG